MWDPIMGVGKTPLITENIAINPYTTIGEEITNLSYISQVTTTSVASGSVLALTDPFYDYVAGDAVTWGENRNTGQPVKVNYLTIDLGKTLYIRGLSYYLQYQPSASTAMEIILYTSLDGVNWTQRFYQAIPVGGANRTDLTIQADGYFRYVKLQCSWGPSVAGGSISYIYHKKLRIWLDSKQNFY